MRVARRFSLTDELRRQAQQRRSLDRAATRYAAARNESLEHADWTNAAMLNGWARYVPVASAIPGAEEFPNEPRAPASYYRDRFGQVHLRGCVEHAGYSTAPILVLPGDLWPARNQRYYSAYKTYAAGLNVFFVLPAAVVIRASDGAVFVEEYRDTSFAGVTWLTLEDIEFRAANAGAA